MSLPEHWPAIEVKSPADNGVVVSPPVRQTRHVSEADVEKHEEVVSPRRRKPMEAVMNALHNLSDKLHHRPQSPTSHEPAPAPTPAPTFKVRYVVRSHVNCGVNWHAPGQEHRTRIGVCGSSELIDQLSKVVDQLQDNQSVVEKINAWLASDASNLELGPLFDGVKDRHNCVVSLIRVAL